MTEKFIVTENGKVYYQISEQWEKNKRVLFFLHGMTGDHTMFRHQYNYFKDSCNILLWDAPAHGKSRPFRNFDYEKAALSVRAIFEAEEIDRAVFIGQSMGGFITQAVIKRYPDIVSSFISIDSTPYGKDELCRLMGIGYAGFIEDNCDLEITCPVLLIIGEKDNTGKVKAYNRLWSRKTGFPLITIKGAAHNSNTDCPDAVNKQIEAFLTSLENAGD